MADPGVVAAATFSVSQSMAAFSTFLPSFTNIREANPTTNPDIVRDVRMGELAAVLVTLGVGGITSSLTGSSVPAIVSGLVSLGLVMLYETALKDGSTLGVDSAAE